ncbi:MAG: TlpA disulfide reductase family protein [Burkholderiales bacterium]|nr:TlpA disulfide reductase family protein [Burkholderiales bacterium]
MPSLARLFIALALLAPPGAAAQALTPWTTGATPPLALTALDGRQHSLADYRGRVVLVNFWATWCAPCRAEMPSLERLRRSLEAEPFVLLAVNVGEDAAAVRAFAERVPMGFPLLLDRDAQASRDWRARALPTTFIVGPEGRIRYQAVGERDWADADIRARLRALMPGARPLETARLAR